MTERYWFNIRVDKTHGDSAMLSHNLCQPPKVLTNPIGKCGRCGFQGELDAFVPINKNECLPQDTLICDSIVYTQLKLGI